MLGEVRGSSIGSIGIMVPVRENDVLAFKFDVWDLNIPFLIVLDVLDQFKMYANTVETFLVCEVQDLKLPLKAEETTRLS